MTDAATINTRRLRAAVDEIVADILDRKIARQIAASRGVARLIGVMQDAEKSPGRPRERTARENAMIETRLVEGATPQQIARELAPRQPHLWDSLERRVTRIRKQQTMSGTRNGKPLSDAA